MDKDKYTHVTQSIISLFNAVELAPDEAITVCAYALVNVFVSCNMSKEKMYDALAHINDTILEEIDNYHAKADKKK